ncbi:MAG: heme exporter protein CcmD [Gammaproteobacteria bacterium]|uniref:Heme exporter protein D n=1 Tax=endosymbiont of Bathymodiolus septemdierum str. Myojin knoll TaxID=1303921 RepID=A0A0P0UR21_9GAMM|nr:heme exporter protein CcmD [Bathymodiolus septemdierum thioautotrophic gill symbiont]RUA05850.1 MAG: heme exporter protein CcmD [Gammaproteobacteria bacterium]BAS67517.1 heme exporter protein D [endosymbiont of Bathymodiolus septemdierum str. Myojin knoll]
MDFLMFDKYTTYIWVSYGLTFAMVAFLFISAKSNHTRVVNQLRVKYARGK